MDTLRILRAEIRRCKVNNENLVREQERQAKVSVVILQSISDLQRQKHNELGANHKVNESLSRQRKQEERTDGLDGSRSKKRHMLSSEDTIRGGTPLSTLERRISTHGQHAGATTRRHHHYRRRREKEQIPEDLKKAKPLTFDGEVKKSEDIEGSLLGMKKLFRVQLLKEHDEKRGYLHLEGKV